MACAICQTRKPRRYCPGVRGEICTVCCGTEREVTVDCPFDCPYLQEARKHERPQPLDPANFPHKEIVVSEKFLYDHEALVIATARALLRAASETPGIVDHDIRDALDTLVQTHATLRSGIFYEARGVNALANQMSRSVQAALDGFRKAEHDRLGMTKTRDLDVLTTLVFMQRLELDRSNGRPRGRAFLDFLNASFGEEPVPVAEQPPSLILP